MKVTENQKKQEVVLTPLPKGKKISEMSHEEILAFAGTIVKGMTPKV
jgi:hypothetical protein